MGANEIVIVGAREHNLKDVSLSLPRDRFIVITGLSGSGKSSLAFDTIYAEGQRRYVESLSAYARQFLGQMNKPDVDSIEGLSPAISIDQKTTSRNPRSTVGTVTEIYDYLRLLYARIGHPHCWICGRPIEGQSKEQIVDQILGLEPGTRFVVKAPVVRGQKGWHKEVLEHIRQEGFTRVEIDGQQYSMDEQLPDLDKNVRHDVSIVVDRLVMKEGVRRRLSDSVETALSEAHGLLMVDVYGRDGERGRRGGTAGDGGRVRRRRPPACSSPRIWPVPSTGCRCPRWRRASSRSTPPTGPARPAAGLGARREIDPEPAGGRSLAVGGGGRAAALERQQFPVLRPDHQGGRRAVRGRHVDALGRAAAGGAGHLPLRHQGREALRLLRQPGGAQAQLHDHLRGDRPQPGATLPGDRLRVHARQDRGVHGRPALPGLRRGPAEAVYSGGDASGG